MIPLTNETLCERYQRDGDRENLSYMYLKQISKKYLHTHYAQCIGTHIVYVG